LTLKSDCIIEFFFGNRSDYVQLGPLVTPDKQCHWLRKRVPNGSDPTVAAVAKKKMMTVRFELTPRRTAERDEHLNTAD
jgi:hypothetical protein